MKFRLYQQWGNVKRMGRDSFSHSTKKDAEEVETVQRKTTKMEKHMEVKSYETWL